MTAPELRGTILELRIERKMIDVADVRAYLGRRGHGRRPALKEVAAIVAKCFGLKPAELSGTSRRQQVVLASLDGDVFGKGFRRNKLEIAGAVFREAGSYDGAA